MLGGSTSLRRSPSVGGCGLGTHFAAAGKRHNCSGTGSHMRSVVVERLINGIGARVEDLPVSINTWA